jgi:hypothetical protein
MIKMNSSNDCLDREKNCHQNETLMTDDIYRQNERFHEATYPRNGDLIIF